MQQENDSFTDKKSLTQSDGTQGKDDSPRENITLKPNQHQMRKE